MNFLLDTYVIYEVLKAKQSKRIIEWFREQDENNLYISALTLGEIHKGIEKIQDINRKRKIHL
jgi:predicted nucleic acid-binding protein